MVTDHEKQRARYLAGSEGAPPVPPPGGYRGARRHQPAIPTIPASATRRKGPTDAASGTQKRPSNLWGRIAVISATLFAVTLLCALFIGGTDLLYSVTLLTLQLLIVAVVVTAVFTARGRMLGAVALVITLLFNVATVGGVSALRTSASGDYEGVKSDEQKHEEAYPAIKGTDPRNALDQPSLEELRTQTDGLFADIRARLTEEFGYTWVAVGDENLRPERNGYRGESMLVGFTSPGWATNEPIQDHDEKIKVMAVIDDVLLDNGIRSLSALSDPLNSGIDPVMLAKLYGSDDPRTQDTWEYYTENYPDPLRFYANIYDLSHDEDGDFLARRETQNARTGEPLEGLQLIALAGGVLSDADRAEFEKKLQDYPGFD